MLISDTGLSAETVIALSFLEALTDEELAAQKNVVRARRYHDGEHDTFLNERLKEFLNVGADEDDKFRLNVCRSVVTAVVERLIVAGFDVAGAQAANGESDPNDKLRTWAGDVWRANRMDAVQDDVHEGATRDGEYFVVVDWDGANKRARLTPHPRYTDTAAEGDGFGCKVFYPDDNLNLPPTHAVKVWTETTQGQTRGSVPTSRQRATVYYPERVVKFIRSTGGGAWEQVRDEGDKGWPLPWVDSAGAPLGMAVIPFQNPGLRPEAWDAIPIQDAINKTLIDILAAGDTTAFRILVALGFTPTTDGQALKADGSNALKIQPGVMVGTTKSKADADFRAIDGADLTPMLNTLNNLALYLAVITDTPVSRFQFTKQIAAEGTLKQQEGPLLAKVHRHQVRFGNAWENCLTLARRLENTFGPSAGSGGGLDEEAAFSTLWTRAETRDEKEHIETLGLKREKLGVPQEQVWREAGYTQEEIDAMKQSDEHQARLALLRSGLGLEQ